MSITRELWILRGLHESNNRIISELDWIKKIYLDYNLVLRRLQDYNYFLEVEGSSPSPFDLHLADAWTSRELDRLILTNPLKIETNKTPY